jgi:hypothetical protein
MCVSVCVCVVFVCCMMYVLIYDVCIDLNPKS